jgi:ferric-dicitrate binding protein FerR (iron transport regulator)
LITKELIADFFEGKCDAQDVAVVQAWLNENPAGLTEYIGLEEWEEFQQDDVLLPDISRKLWGNVEKGSFSSSVGHRYLRWGAVAASLLLVVGVSWQLLSRREETIGASAVGTAKNISNKTSRKMALTLSDGSAVELLPNSTLSYSGKFNSLKREVLLNGEAGFDIAKDAARPFSVQINSVLIRVLGTRFTVNSYEANNVTKVVLQDGRIMVKIPDPSFRDNNEYYLKPGDVFIFKGGLNDSLHVRVFHLEKDKDDRYVFNNCPLDVVFDQLQVIYNAKIIYNKAELGNKSFIGKIDQKDSLPHILKGITLLTNFGLKEQDDSFIVSK